MQTSNDPSNRDLPRGVPLVHGGPAVASATSHASASAHANPNAIATSLSLADLTPTASTAKALVKDAKDWASCKSILESQLNKKDPELLARFKELAADLSEALPRLCEDAKGKNIVSEAVATTYVELAEKKSKLNPFRYMVKAIAAFTRKQEDHLVADSILKVSPNSDSNINVRAHVAAQLIDKLYGSAPDQGVRPLPPLKGVSLDSTFGAFFLDNAKYETTQNGNAETSSENKILRDYEQKRQKAEERLRTPEALVLREKFRAEIISETAQSLGLQIEGRVSDYETSTHKVGKTTLFCRSCTCKDGTQIRLYESSGSYSQAILDYQIEVKRTGRSEDTIRLSNLDTNRLLQGDRSVLTPRSIELEKLSNLALYHFIQNAEAEVTLVYDKGNYRAELVLANGKLPVVHSLLQSESRDQERAANKILGSRLTRIVDEALAIDINLVRRPVYEAAERKAEFAKENVLLFKLNALSLKAASDPKIILKALTNTVGYDQERRGYMAVKILKGMIERSELLANN